MIPTTDNLKEINPELTKALKNFPDLINQWEEKLRALTPYCSVMFPDPLKDADYNVCDTNPSLSDFEYVSYSYDNEQFFELNTVIAFHTMACTEQWLRDPIFNWWPESIPNGEIPFNLIVNFCLGNEAVIKVYGSAGNCIWSEDELMGKLKRIRYQPEKHERRTNFTYLDDTYTGTWEEVYNHLVNLIDLVGTKTKIE
ncbi:hypothetical protein CL684_02535 [Candidatus Campbellbacteria bacterium]|nr:hypothetical protein [Candidatus Campbellbacteria bacterium]|tara:strand:- start:2627 stop:3220 length:594 start_codon:yes stop_codon:yes gene_type:complete